MAPGPWAPKLGGVYLDLLSGCPGWRSISGGLGHPWLIIWSPYKDIQKHLWEITVRDVDL